MSTGGCFGRRSPGRSTQRAWIQIFDGNWPDFLVSRFSACQMLARYCREKEDKRISWNKVLYRGALYKYFYEVLEFSVKRIRVRF